MGGGGVALRATARGTAGNTGPAERGVWQHAARGCAAAGDRNPLPKSSAQGEDSGGLPASKGRETAELSSETERGQ